MESQLDAQKIGSVIKFLRQRVNYTQKELAEKLNVSDKAVSKWERGLGVPDVSLLRNLSVILDIDIDSLLEGNVVSLESMWKGVLYLDNDFALSTIYDKPGYHYLISHFLLLKITSVIIFCSEKAKKMIYDDLKEGENIGVELSYCIIDGSAGEMLEKYKSKLSNYRLMIIYQNEFIYGVDLTRFLYKALISEKKYTMLSFPCNNTCNQIGINDNKCISKVVSRWSNDNFRYSYKLLPILFCKDGLNGLLSYHGFSIKEIVDEIISTGEVYAELMDKGYITFSMNNADEVNDTANFVRLVQQQTGYKIADLVEIAYRRALISDEKTNSFAILCDNQEKSYLFSVIKSKNK